MKTKNPICCWYDPVTGLTTCGSCFVQAPLVIPTARQSAASAKAAVADPSLPQITTAAAGAATTLATAAGVLSNVFPWIAAAQGIVGLAQIAIPAIQRLIEGKEVSVEDQAAVKAFVDSIRDGSRFQKPEWQP
jgi:hypothetical protein